MRRPINVPEEVSLLAEHHKAILESRFPDYDYEYLDHPYRNDCMQLVVSDDGITVLTASFSSNSIHTRLNRGRRIIYGILDTGHDSIDIDYADPQFTENMLSDMLERLRR